VYHVIGDVRDGDVVIVDDMVDTGGTLVQSAEALKAQGAKRVFAASTHPILSGEARKRIQESALERVIVTNTIPIDKKPESENKIHVLSVAELFGEAVRRIHEGSSVSILFS
jgi:ribose-phosphate pyrophosphokinase